MSSWNAYNICTIVEGTIDWKSSNGGRVFSKNAQYIHYLNHYTHYWLTLSHLTEAYTKIPGLCGEYPALPNTAFQRPYSGHVSKRRPAGAWGNWISIGIQQNSFYSVFLFCKKSWIEVQLTSWPHSRKMKGIRFPELPMITSSGKALHSYPSMSIFKITSSASMLAWLKKGHFI